MPEPTDPVTQLALDALQLEPEEARAELLAAARACPALELAPGTLSTGPALVARVVARGCRR